MNFETIQSEGTTFDLPGIYAWRIEGVGTYVGRYTNRSRPVREYANNVRKLLAGEPYRKSKPGNFRHIHRVLALAMQEGRSISLLLVQNCSVEELNEREQFWIAEIGIGSLNRL